MAEAVLSERAQQVLKSLVECYVRDGEPVGSKALARESGLDLSPASIRNVMAELERLGFILSPHTSAGRVPTVLGYRMFVDSLVTVQPPDAREVRELRETMAAGAGTQHLLESASGLLSGITRMAGIVMLPRHAQAALKHIEFVPLSERRVLAVMVFSDGEIQNRIIEISRAFTPSELQQASNFLNSELRGKTVADLRRSLLGEMRQTRDHIDRIMVDAIDMAQKAFEGEQSRPDLVWAGETNLMTYREMADVGKLRDLFDAFHHKQAIVQLLDQSLSANGVQIFIGSESGHRVLDDCSVVTASYSVDQNVVGVLGVIGPTRMAYDRVIPIVDITARLLGQSLKQRI